MSIYWLLYQTWINNSGIRKITFSEWDAENFVSIIEYIILCRKLRPVINTNVSILYTARNRIKISPVSFKCLLRHSFQLQLIINRKLLYAAENDGNGCTTDRVITNLTSYCFILVLDYGPLCIPFDSVFSSNCLEKWQRYYKFYNSAYNLHPLPCMRDMGLGCNSIRHWPSLKIYANKLTCKNPRKIETIKNCTL
jgi:hypothetical protein